MFPVDATKILAPVVWVMVGLLVISVIGILASRNGWFRRRR
jgi:uncharacterized protein HemY